MSQPLEYDLLILGGGINGMGIAADASGRSLRVLLCDKHDFGSGTSSASSKMIHGGLRYLEHFAFRLVNESLHEREILLKTAPHLVQKMNFILPYHPKLRSRLALRLGLYLYDAFASDCSLPRSRSIRLANNTLDNPLACSFTKGYSYSDCVVDDARLVISNAIRAKELGATLLPRCEVVSIQAKAGQWHATLKQKGSFIQVKAKVCINATGPWISEVLKNQLNIESKIQIRGVKGSHIVVPRLYEHNHSYLLQHKDGRAVFVIPYHQYTMIGTTDLPFNEEPEKVRCSHEEMDYLCEVVSSYFHHPVKTQDIINHWSGVRPLVDDKNSKLSKINREHHLELLELEKGSVLLNIFGGKLTTYRALAESALSLIKPFFPAMGPKWTATTPLPGGDIANWDLWMQSLHERYPFLRNSTLERMGRAYGSRVDRVLNHAQSLSDLGRPFGNDLYESEINYLKQEEWATQAEDVLWRRTKLGLTLSSAQIKVFTEAWENLPNAPSFKAVS